MGILRSISGMITVKIRTASLPELLDSLTSSGISVYNLRQDDELTVTGVIYRSHYRRLHEVIQRRNEEIFLCEKGGIYWSLREFLRRPVLIVGISLLFILSIYLPTRVLFIDVEGNQNIARNQILKSAADAGISFGASRRLVRSEKVKNALLLSIPELQWVGINTRGCTAVISIKERSKTEDSSKSAEIASIVAGCDGIIQSIVVTRGNPVCSVGQAVLKDQVLISGFTDCGLLIKLSGAEGEITARTYRNVETVKPINYTTRSDLAETTVRYSIKIGKKLIKLYKGSGISDTSCAKIYTEFQMELPGGFLLPVMLLKEEIYHGNISIENKNEECTYDRMDRQVEKYLLNQIVAGEILQKTVLQQSVDDAIYTSYAFVCRESIGRYRIEEKVTNGKRD